MAHRFIACAAVVFCAACSSSPPEAVAVDMAGPVPAYAAPADVEAPPVVIYIADVAALAAAPGIPDADPRWAEELAMALIPQRPAAALVMAPSGDAERIKVGTTRRAPAQKHIRTRNKSGTSDEIAPEKGEWTISSPTVSAPTAKLALIEVDADGRRPLTHAEIKQQVNGSTGQVRQCYEQAMKRDEGLHGRIVMSWDILADGSVEGAHIAAGDVDDAQLTGCIVNVVSRWRFPKGVETQSVDIPFVLARTM